MSTYVAEKVVTLATAHTPCLFLNRLAHSRATLGDPFFLIASSSVWNATSNDVRCVPPLSSLFEDTRFVHFTKTKLFIVIIVHVHGLVVLLIFF